MNKRHPHTQVRRGRHRWPRCPGGCGVTFLPDGWLVPWKFREKGSRRDAMRREAWERLPYAERIRIARRWRDLDVDVYDVKAGC